MPKMWYLSSNESGHLNHPLRHLKPSSLLLRWLSASDGFLHLTKHGDLMML